MQKSAGAWCLVVCTGTSSVDTLESIFTEYSASSEKLAGFATLQFQVL